MQKHSTTVAFLLIGVIVFAWMMYAQRKQQAARQQQAQGQTQPASDAPGRPEGQEVTPPVVTPAATVPAIAPTPTSVVPLQDYIVTEGDNLEYKLVWSNQGAYLRQARLTRYAEKRGSEMGVIILDERAPGLPGTLALRDPNRVYAFDTQNYEVTREDDGRIIFTAGFGDGLRVTKEFTPLDGKNELGVSITFANEGKDELYARYEIVAAERMMPAGYATPLLFGPVAYRRSNGEVDINLGQPSTGKSWWPFGNKVKMPYTRESNSEEKILWAGAENRYFAAVLMAEDSGDIKADDLIFSTRMSLLEGVDEITTSRGSVRRQDNLTVAVAPAPAKLAPGQSVTHRYTYFMGPKLQELLVIHEDKGLPAVLDYGMFGVVSRVLLWFLALFNRFVGNYGVGIIMLTILVKACLHPFTRKSQIAMHKMQKLQPLIKELQAKFKGDRQKLGQAQMELMRKHNANPMGGCWPMFFQLPVFLGLFRMLQYSVHLRHAEFFWWIKDLSQPDTITHISGFPINILPVLMVISWLFQSMSQPKSADPQQAQTQKMMMFMPIMFGFMLYGMASGLTLYWLTSTSVGIIEQRWIKRQIAQMDAEGAFAAEDDELEEAKTRKQKSRSRPKRK